VILAQFLFLQEKDSPKLNSLLSDTAKKKPLSLPEGFYLIVSASD